MSLPQTIFIIDYNYVFGEEPPEENLSLVQNLSRKSLLMELAGLNYRLKPKDQTWYDTSLEKQLKELKYFTAISYDLYLFYRNFLLKAEKDQGSANLFTRQGCIYGLEDVVNSSLIQDIDDFKMSKKEVWDSIIRYLLAINSTITEIKKEETDRPGLEKLNPKLLVLNELNSQINPIHEAYRGYRLIDYLMNTKLSEHLKAYFFKTYQLDPKEYCFQILSIYVSNNNSEDSNLDFYYQVDEKFDSLFSVLSKHYPNQEIFKLLRIRKSPFVKVKNLAYVLSDNNFLIEKLFTQFINDFWFDYLKPNETINIREYRGVIGQFIEMYLSEIIRNAFSQNLHIKLLLFDELKIKVDKNEIEVADLYLRYNKKILLAQVKSTSIYDKEKYGGDIMSLYKGNRDEFFKNFGINQLISSIQNLEKYFEYFDPGYPHSGLRKIYPCLIVSDKAIQTPLMAQVFNERFQELTQNFSNKKLKIYALTVIHISDFERLEESLFDSPNKIWTLLEYNFRNSGFIPPFYNTINRKVPPKNFFSKRIEDLYELVREYSA